MKQFYSNGKLLITGEYLVLESALALALPTKFGQYLKVTETETNSLLWKSIDNKGQTWFESELRLDNVNSEQAFNTMSISEKLNYLLVKAKSLNPTFLRDKKGFAIESKLTFPREWGLGTSSTLINNIAQWAEVNAFKLSQLTFGGSGYDIACAQINQPILYRLLDKVPLITKVPFNPSFSECLYFLYLGNKQDSREGIKAFYQNKGAIRDDLTKINAITEESVSCDNLVRFMELMEKHESIISSIINQVAVKKRLFNDFTGAIKSLGAWGGDFVLVASKTNPKDYFDTKGYKVLLNYNEIII